MDIKYRSYWKGVNKMVYFDTPRFDYTKNGEVGIFIPAIGGSVFLGPSTDMLFSGKQDKKGKDIYDGDILKLINREGKEMLVLCQYGSFERQLRNFMGEINNCEITGFAFLVANRYPTFPLVKNYLNKNDLQIMEVIGNIHEHPELLNPVKKEQ